MIVIENILISDDVVESQFVCDLAKCKGGCCEEGDAGAPLSEEELRKVKDSFPKIKHYLTEASIQSAEDQQYYTYDNEFGWVTPTMHNDNGICSYAIREKDGQINCAFEKGYNEGLISWKKPISCHLYPIIVYKGKHGDYDRMNYEPRKTLCKCGWKLGEKLKVLTYQFLKEPLVRKYGEEFYETLDAIAQAHYINKEND